MTDAYVPFRVCPRHPETKLVVRLGTPGCPVCRKAAFSVAQKRRFARQRVDLLLGKKKA